MLRLLTTMLALCLLSGVLANDVRIRGEAKVQPLGKNSTTAVITFPLSWEHSWREAECWDAVYIFVKYRRKGLNEPWHHAFLKNDPKAHTAGGGGTVPPMEFFPTLSEIDPWLDKDEVIWSNYQASTPRTVKNASTGVFLFRKTPGVGNISIPRVSLQWEFSQGDLSLYHNLTAEEILNGDIEVSVQAIEMVFVPNGPYYLGDRITPFSFVSQRVDGAYYIDSDGSMQLYMMGETGMSGIVAAWELPERFPAGYNGFYTMKYEVSQEQYVNFLNRLEYADQKQRIGNNLDHLKVGEFAFGNRVYDTEYRNGIVLEHRYPDNETAAVFGFDLHADDPLNSELDGKSLPCNFLTPADLRAYADWIGLRPHSEMEYEKTSRERNPVADGTYSLRAYAWGTPNSTPLAIFDPSTIQNLNSEEEYVTIPLGGATAGRVNGPRSHGRGPVRVGAFANETSNIYESGASKWGLMEITGNLAEIQYNAHTGRTFNGQKYGDGNIWSSVVTWKDTTLVWEEYVGYYSNYYWWYGYGHRTPPRINKVVTYPDVINRYNRPLSVRVLWEYPGSWSGTTITFRVTLPWPEQSWPKGQGNFILRGGSFMTPAPDAAAAANNMALSYRGDDTYQTADPSALRLPHTGFRAGVDVPLLPMKYIGIIAGENGLQRDTAVVCAGNPYTFQELAAGDDQDDFTIYNWEMKKAGDAWASITGSDVKELEVNCCLVQQNSLMTEYTYRRRSIASHSEAYGREVTLIVPGYKINGGSTQLNLGQMDATSIPLRTELGIAGDVTIECETAPGTWQVLYTGVGKTLHDAELRRSEIPAVYSTDGGVCPIRVTINMGGCEFVHDYRLHVSPPHAACPASVEGGSGITYIVETLPGDFCWFVQDLQEPINVTIGGSVQSQTGFYSWDVIALEKTGVEICPGGFRIAGYNDWDYLWLWSSVYQPLYPDAGCDDYEHRDYLSSSMCSVTELYHPGLERFVDKINLAGSTRSNGDWWAASGNTSYYVNVFGNYTDPTDWEARVGFSLASNAATTPSIKKPIRCVKNPKLQ